MDRRYTSQDEHGRSRDVTETGRGIYHLSLPVTFASLLPISLVVICQYDNSSVTARQRGFYQWTWIGTKSTAVLLLIFLLYKAVRVGRPDVNVAQEAAGRISNPSKVKLGCLWVFGCGVTINYIIELTVSISFWLKTHVHTYLVIVLDSSISIIETLLQLIFITYFRSSKFPRSLAIMLSLLLVTVINLSAGFSVLRRSAANNDSTNFTTFDSWDSQIENQQVVFMHSYLLPCLIEFSVLASSFIFSFLPNDANDGDDDGHQRIRESVGIMSFMSRQFPCRQKIYLAAAFVINFGMIMSTFTCTIKADKGTMHVILIVWDMFNCLHNLVVMILIFQVFHILSHQATHVFTKCPFDFLEIILFACAVWNIFYSAFQLITVRNTSNFTYAVNISTTLYQTILILYAKRIHNVNPNDAKHMSFLFLILSISGLIVWGESLVCAADYTIFRQQHPIHSNYEFWDDCIKLLYYLIIYYHFQSAIDMYSLFIKFRS